MLTEVSMPSASLNEGTVLSSTHEAALDRDEPSCSRQSRGESRVKVHRSKVKVKIAASEPCLKERCGLLSEIPSDPTSAPAARILSDEAPLDTSPNRRAHRGALHQGTEESLLQRLSLGSDDRREKRQPRRESLKSTRKVQARTPTPVLSRAETADLFSLENCNTHFSERPISVPMTLSSLSENLTNCGTDSMESPPKARNCQPNCARKDTSDLNPTKKSYRRQKITPQSQDKQPNGCSPQCIHSEEAPTKPQMKTHRPRSSFVQDCFVPKLSIGNTNISTSNVLFVERSVFLAQGSIPRYSELSHGHTTAPSLSETDVVLFIVQSCADTSFGSHETFKHCENLPFQIIQLFLTSPIGLHITHLWLECSCICPDKRTETYSTQLDNILTAIFLADVLLIVPKLAVTCDDWSEQPLLYTDLQECTHWGWGVLEIIVALFARTEIYLTYLVSAQGEVTEISTQFSKVGEGLEPGSDVDMAMFTDERHFISSRSFKPVTESVCSDRFPLLIAEIKDNWNSAADPARTASKVLQAVGFTKSKNLVSNTAILLDRNAREAMTTLVSSVKFLNVEDESIVINALGTLAGFLRDGYETIGVKSHVEIEHLATSLVGIKVKEMDLTKKDLFPKDVQMVLQQLSENNTTSEPFPSVLKLDENPLGYNVVKAFSGAELKDRVWAQLQELWLNGCSLGDKGVIDLVAAIACRKNVVHLLNLSLASNRVGDAGATAIASNTTLRTLNLEKNNIEDAGAVALSQNTTLTALNLSKNEIGITGVRALAENSTLSQLRLTNNNTKDAGAKALAENSTLSDLDLGANSIGDEGALALAKNFSLKTLSLRGNGITDTSVAAFSRNTTLTSLDLSFNSYFGHIGDEGASALSRNTSLTELNLRGNSVLDSGAAALARNRALTSLDLGENGVITAAKALARSTNLVSLSLDSNFVRSSGAAALANNTSLTSLNLRFNQIGDSGAEMLALNSTLTALDLGANRVGIQGTSALTKNVTLTTLYLEDQSTKSKKACCSVQ